MVSCEEAETKRTCTCSQWLLYLNYLWLLLLSIHVGSRALTLWTGSVSCWFLAVEVWCCKWFWSEAMYFWISAGWVTYVKLFLTSPVSKHQQICGEHQLYWLDILTQIWCFWPRFLLACKTCFLRGVRLSLLGTWKSSKILNTESLLVCRTGYQ